MMRNLIQAPVGSTVILAVLAVLLPIALWAQTDCEAGNGPLDSAPPKTTSVPEVIQKLGAAEAAAKEARLHYTYKQDVLMQTVVGKDVTGEFHEVTNVSYDAKGRRQEEVTFAAQNTLRGLQLTEQDMDDIRIFMPLMLTKEDLPLYNLTYAGQQHVDDLDTYQFRVAPKKRDEKGKRYFEGQIWVDAQDFQIVKVCGKSGPEKVQVKKHEQSDVHPTFVTYCQQVDGRYWFPAYTRSDDTLHFKARSVKVKEVIKYSGYKRAQ
jgi:outer membrane lipoprotein-sorting protein